MIFGASFDTPEENAAFRDAQGFPYGLLSDVSRSTGEAYGVLRDGGPYSDYPKRKSFLIDPSGIVVRTYEVDDVAGHASAVLADLDVLQQADSRD